MADGAPTSAFDLTGRLARITGSSRGIGRTLAAGLLTRRECGSSTAWTRTGWPQRRPSSLHNTVLNGCRRAFDVTDQCVVVDAIAWIETRVGPMAS
jgi:gluconate 5-dehydrogenase